MCNGEGRRTRKHKKSGNIAVGDGAKSSTMPNGDAAERNIASARTKLSYALRPEKRGPKGTIREAPAVTVVLCRN